MSGALKNIEALVDQPIRLVAVHKGEVIAEQVFQHTPIRLGRLVENDIVLPFDFVSRFHCELRFENGGWTAADLGSKNGLLAVGRDDSESVSKAREIPLNDGAKFRIQEVTLHITHEVLEDVVKDFTAIRESGSVINATKMNAVEESSGKKPLLLVDTARLLFSPYPEISGVKAKALQMSVVWHDQVLDTREIPIGAPLRLDFQGERLSLGTVKAEKTQIKIPKGAKPVGDLAPSGRHITVHWDEPTAFRIDDVILISFRYVPKSKEMARSTEWIEQKLLDPMIASSAIHGAAAVAAIFLGPKKQIPLIRDEPERFATIIVQPTPVAVVVAPPSPSPTPPALAVQTPVPTPEPTPLIAKKEIPVPTPNPEILKKVVSMKKMKRPAIRKKEEVATESKLAPKVAKALPPPRPDQPKEPPKEIAKNDEPPAPAPPEVAPTATPQPFNAKSVGTLKMLSALSLGPASEVAAVEKIQISRAPASVAGASLGREAVAGTGEMVAKLAQSVRGSGTSKGEGTANVSVGGKSGGAQYKLAGLSGKSGNRKVKGSVLGGASYSELSKNEGLTREQVMKVVQKHQTEIQACYERSLMQNPDIVGRAEFEWEISAKGVVNLVNVKETTLKNGENLLACVKGVFVVMKFPEAKNGESTTPTIGLPFGRL